MHYATSPPSPSTHPHPTLTWQEGVGRSLTPTLTGATLYPDHSSSSDHTCPRWCTMVVVVVGEMVMVVEIMVWIVVGIVVVLEMVVLVKYYLKPNLKLQ